MSHELSDQAEKYLKNKDTYKTYTKLKKNKQKYFYNEHTEELILFEGANKYLKEHFGESVRSCIEKPQQENKELTQEKK